MHEARLTKIEAEMTTVLQQKVSEKEDKLKQSEKELYARYREMREALDKQLNEKQRRLQLVRAAISGEHVVVHI
jgi:septin 7